MYLATSEEMRAIDRHTIETIGIPALALMENAGRAIAEEAARRSAGGAAKWIVLVGKGNNGGDVCVNATGNPGMATGGAGDVLAGLVASLLAQGLDARQAAAAGVHLHGAAGDRAAAARAGESSLLAGDIADAL